MIEAEGGDANAAHVGFEEALTLARENGTQFQEAEVLLERGKLNSRENSSLEALADLKLVVNDPQGPVPVGKEATYEIHIINRGTKAADYPDEQGGIL